ncbi:MAG: 50S ribosomal protein L11 methyltransferase [Mangrovicoccus sp.]|nr:50S ribosomal protein L11 methyltransferase [Mangrovicoccus sp.]
MPTWTALTTLPGKAPAEALGAALDLLDPAPYGIGVFEIEDGSGLWEVGGYFEAAPDDTALALLAAAHGAKVFAISELPDTDWVAHVQRELAPVEAGRFFLYGSHDAEKLPEDRVGLLIEAAMAFGTGHHGTTAGCLEAFDAELSAGLAPAAVADIGCGTAVLAMAAAKAWPDMPVVAGDIDPVAVEVAEANLQANDLAGRVVCVTAAGTDDPAIAEGAPYGLVFANILKGPLIELAPDLVGITAQNGRIILAGLLNDQAEDVAAAYAAQGCREIARLVRGDWTILTFERG